MRFIFAALSLVLLASCVTPPASSPGPVATPTPLPVSDDAEVITVKPLEWEKGHPERAPWSAELRDQLKRRLFSFDKASDWKKMCPTWGSLLDHDKVEVLATFAVAVAYYESSWQPAKHYPEPDLGFDSIGLYQMSYQDKSWIKWCVMDSKTKSLEQPINNIRCAIPEMARLVEKDGVLFDGYKTGNAKGMARYWSVTRPLVSKKGVWVKRPAYEAITLKVRSLPACR